MDDFVPAFVGFVIGVFVGAGLILLSADYRATKRGWIEYDGKFYVLTPAKPVPSP